MMLVKEKEYEYDAGEYAKRFAKAWDYYCICVGAYLSGYRRAKEQIAHRFNAQWYEIHEVGTSIVEREVNDGMHQLSVRTFAKWKEENSKVSFDEAMFTYLEFFDIKSLFVCEQNGVISFQGTAKRKV